MCRYGADSAQWSLWILHCKVGKSNDKTQRAYISILCHVEVEIKSNKWMLFHTKPNMAVTKVHRFLTCHTYTSSSALVNKIVISNLNKFFRRQLKCGAKLFEGQVIHKNVHRRDMVP